jgi:hypothetical protein
MEYLVNRIIFQFIYLLIYAAPLGLILEFYEKFIKRFLPNDISSFIYGIILILALIAIIFSGYRARVAAKCKVESNMKFLEAHQASWALIKVNLSFIPVIGYLFRNKDKST